MKLLTWRLAQITLATYILIFSILGSYIASDLFIRPVTIIDLTIANPSVHAGSKITVHVEYERHKICKTEIDRFLLARGTEGTYRVVFREQVPGLLILGHDQVDVDVSTPANLPAGKYEYIQYLISYCSAITRVDPYPVREINIIANPSSP